MTDSHNIQQWLYLKIYLGDATDKMDDVLIELARLANAQTAFSNWFYIRYFDESGFHIRFRVMPQPGKSDAAKQALAEIWSEITSNLTQFMSSAYVPMTELPNFDAASLKTNQSMAQIDAVYAVYEREYDKFGGEAGMPLAEAVFCHSSDLATRILLGEREGQFSRKTLLPMLMMECFESLKIKNAPDFWRQYSQFWLGGDTPAAEDRREVFFEKARELQASGISILTSTDELPNEAVDILHSWRAVLKEAYVSYQKIKDNSEFSYNVLCFNFSHLMMNRLGLTAIEESYMAALLEQYVTREMAA